MPLSLRRPRASRRPWYVLALALRFASAPRPARAQAPAADSLVARLPLDSVRGAVFGTTWGDNRAAVVEKALAFGFQPDAGQDSLSAVFRGTFAGRRMLASMSFSDAGGRAHLAGMSLMVAAPLDEMHRVYCAEWRALTSQRHLRQRPVAESGCSPTDNLDAPLTGPLGVRRESWRGSETHHEMIDLMAFGPRTMITLVIVSPDAVSRWAR